MPPHLPAVMLLTIPMAAALPKILCLHGGGMSGPSFQSTPGMVALQNSLGTRFEFVFATSPLSNGVWWNDPPGGKGQATTDPDWAATSIAYIDGLVSSQGPFVALLGYSQGAAMVPLYLSQTTLPIQFQVVMSFCGYLPSTHTGLENRINAASPFGNIPALVWMGAQDSVISNSMTQAQAAKFTSPVVLTSSVAGHDVPDASDPTYTSVLAFFDRLGGPPSPPLAPLPPSLPPQPKPPPLSPPGGLGTGALVGIIVGGVGGAAVAMALVYTAMMSAAKGGSTYAASSAAKSAAA